MATDRSVGVYVSAHILNLELQLLLGALGGALPSLSASRPCIIAPWGRNNLESQVFEKVRRAVGLVSLRS